MGQAITTSQWYLYGKANFTRTGWEKASKLYTDPTFLDTVDLKSRVYVVTGANSGIGFEISKYLASKNATLYMVCRSAARGEAAQKRVVEETKNENVHLMLGDASLRTDVDRIVAEFKSREPKLHGLLCNAGALLNEKKLTSEGLETTMACHLLFGTYHLTKNLLPSLQAAADEEPRVVFMSSGGMYNTKFPRWEIAAAEQGTYDGNLAYSYAKRGQVLLAEQWAVKYPWLKVVSTHPGWTSTPGVDTALADTKSWLEPLRTTWQGSEGTCWLLSAATSDIESGAFYLDRAPRTKHLAGYFMTEGNATRNTPEEVDEMMIRLEKWSNLPFDQFETELKLDNAAYTSISSKPPKLTARTGTDVDLKSYMGRWYVISCIPTYFEKGINNSVENYSLVEGKTDRVAIHWTYCSTVGGPTKSFDQKAWVKPKTAHNTHWIVQPVWPLETDYLILECPADYSYTVIGVPNRAYMWIMARTKTMDETLYAEIVERLRREHLYNTSLIVRVPQIWPEDESQPESADTVSAAQQ
jgi:dehydrogenase/reductase SDR family protein 12